MIAALLRIWPAICAWYRETHTSASTKMLSNRNQVYSLVMVAACVVLVRDGWKNGIKRDWTEALAVMLTGATAAKVWKRKENTDAATPKGTDTPTG